MSGKDSKEVPAEFDELEESHADDDVDDDRMEETAPADEEASPSAKAKKGLRIRRRRSQQRNAEVKDEPYREDSGLLDVSGGGGEKRKDSKLCLYDPTFWSPALLYRKPAYLVGKAVRESGGAGLSRAELSVRVGCTIKSLAPILQQVESVCPDSIGVYQKMEGRQRTCRYYWKEQTPAMHEHIDEFEQLSGGRKLSLNQAVKFPSHLKLPTLRLSDVVVQRLNWILRTLAENSYVIGRFNLEKMLNYWEGKVGRKHVCDRRTLAKLLQTLEIWHLIRRFAVRVDGATWTKQVEVIFDRTVEPDGETWKQAILLSRRCLDDHKDLNKIKTASDAADCRNNQLKLLCGDEMPSLSAYDLSDNGCMPCRTRRNFLLLTTAGISVTTEASIRTTSVVKVDPLPLPELSFHRKFDQLAPQFYGLTDKVHQLQIVHELLVYLLYKAPADGSFYTKFPPDVPFTKAISKPYPNQTEPTVYSDVESWPRFLPPLPSFQCSRRGWFLINDLALCLPLSLLLLILPLKHRIDNVEFYSAHPIRRHTLLVDLPVCLRRSLVGQAGDKLIGHLRLLVLNLGLMGWIVSGRCDDRDTVAHDRHFHPYECYFLNERVELLDTSTSKRKHGGRVSSPADLWPYPRYVYAAEEAAAYWVHLFAVVVSTRVNARTANDEDDLDDDDEPDRVDYLRKRLTDALPFKSVEDRTPKQEIGEEAAVPEEIHVGIPLGDRGGAAGMPCCLSIQHFQMKLTRCFGLYQPSQSSWYWLEWTKRVAEAERELLLETKVERLDQLWIKRHSDFRLFDAVRRSRWPSARQVASKKIKERCHQVLSEGSGSADQAQEQQSEEQLKKPLLRHQLRRWLHKKTRNKELSFIKGQAEVRRVAEDSLDRELLLQQKHPAIRVHLSRREDEMLVFIKALSIYMNPSATRFWLKKTLVRDLMHSCLPESQSKASEIFFRRLAKVSKKGKLNTMLNHWLGQFSKLEFLQEFVDIKMTNWNSKNSSAKKELFSKAFHLAFDNLIGDRLVDRPTLGSFQEAGIVIPKETKPMKNAAVLLDDAQKAKLRLNDEATVAAVPFGWNKPADSLATVNMVALTNLFYSQSLLPSEERADYEASFDKLYSTFSTLEKCQALVELRQRKILTGHIVGNDGSIASDGDGCQFGAILANSGANRSKIAFSLWFRQRFIQRSETMEQSFRQLKNFLSKEEAGGSFVPLTDSTAGGLLAAVETMLDNGVAFEIGTIPAIEEIEEPDECDDWYSRWREDIGDTIKRLDIRVVRRNRQAVAARESCRFEAALDQLLNGVVFRSISDEKAALDGACDLLTCERERANCRRTYSLIQQSGALGISTEEISNSSLDRLKSVGLVVECNFSRRQRVITLANAVLGGWLVASVRPNRTTALIDEESEAAGGELLFRPRPWLRPDGSLNRAGFRWLAEGTLMKMLSSPSLVEQQLFDHFQTLLQPRLVQELVTFLLDIGCFSRTRLGRRDESNRFCCPSEDQQVYFEPSIDALARFDNAFENCKSLGDLSSFDSATVLLSPDPTT